MTEQIEAGLIAVVFTSYVVLYKESFTLYKERQRVTSVNNTKDHTRSFILLCLASIRLKSRITTVFCTSLLTDQP
jgi:hypothetical protein